MEPMGQKKDLIFGDPYHIGYERFGEDHCEEPKSQAEIDALFQEFLDQCGEDADKIPEANKAMIRATYAGMPYIEENIIYNMLVRERNSMFMRMGSMWRMHRWDLFI